MSETPTSPFMDISRQTAALISVVVAPLALIIGEFAGFGRGMAALIAVTCIAVSIRFAWPLRGERWFWCLIVIVTAAHALALHLLDWSWLARLGKAVGLLMYPDLAVIIALIYLMYRGIYGRPSKPVESDPDDAPRYGQRNLEL